MIRLSDEWGIDTDAYNYILVKRGSKKKDRESGEFLKDENGNPVYIWISYGYFNTLEGALKQFGQITCRETVIDKTVDNEDISVSEAIRRISNRYDEFEAQIKEATRGM